MAKIRPGTHVGGFEVGPLLGIGSMGQVYLARQLSMDRHVALKILPIELIRRDQEAVQQFLGEVRMLAKLDHPNMVTAFEAGEYEGTYYLAMTYVNGESLEQRLQREPVLAEGEAFRYLLKVAQALEYAWTHYRMLHRDIKPSNIMIDNMGDVKLMDMGIAKAASEDEAGARLVMGTPYYMSPEQAMARKLDWRSDQYSMGATLYHLLTGRTPFTGKDSQDIMTRHVNEPLLAPREVHHEVSALASNIVGKMMEKLPERRFNDWGELINAMRDVIEMARRRPKPESSAERAEALLRKKSGTRTRTQGQISVSPSRLGPPRRYGGRGSGSGRFLVFLVLLLLALFLSLGVANRAGVFRANTARLPQYVFPVCFHQPSADSQGLSVPGAAAAPATRLAACRR